jgi:hypothetical protein
MTATGRRVDHFREEDLFTRPQFADVAAHFRATGEVEPGMLHAATARFARFVLACDVDMVVADARWPVPPPGRIQDGCGGTPASWLGMGLRQNPAILPQ